MLQPQCVNTLSTVPAHEFEPNHGNENDYDSGNENYFIKLL